MKARSCLATFAITCLGLAPNAPASPTTQDLDNEGTEFLCGFLPNGRGVPQAVPPDLEVHLTSGTPAVVDLVYPVGAATPTFTTTVNVTPGSIEIVTIPSEAATDWVEDMSASNLVGISSDQEVTAYLINRQPFTSDAGLALPVDTLNTEFILSDYATPFFVGQGHFIVFAQFDDTTVTITPTVDLIGGRVAGTAFDVVLDAGEGYFGRVANAGTDQNLTGTIIESDRVIGVTSGNNCATVPSGFNFCDAIFEVLQPTQTWGNEYIAANLPNRPNGSIYRIIGTEDGTEILFNGTSIGVVGRGDFIEHGPTAEDGLFESAGDQPFFVTQFMTGRTFSSVPTGDPAMGNVVSPEQYKDGYTFSTVGGSQFSEHWITIIARTVDVGAVELNGTAVASASFTPVGSTSFSVARLMVPEGTYTTSSPGRHGVTVQGFNTDDSYLYPGGARFDFINNVGDANPPLCDQDPIAGLTSVSTTVRDDRPTEDVNGNGALDPGEDLNGNGLIDEDTGVFFVTLDPASVNLNLSVAPFQPGDPAVDVTVELLDPSVDGIGEVVVVDGAGNEARCQVDLRGTLGTIVCKGVPNSTGQASRTTVGGSLLVADNTTVLRTDLLPPSVLGFYVNSREENFVPNPGGSQGNLCIASLAMGRHNRSMAMTSAAGTTSLALDLLGVPFEPGTVAVVLAGETWYWQYWHRDTVGGALTSNFSSAVSVTFQ